MCGFFFTNKKSLCGPCEFEDVLQRGIEHTEIVHKDIFAIQSILPTIQNSIDFSIYDTPDYIFLYTGEIYNYDRTCHTNDTQQVVNDILSNRSIDHYNGMYAFVFYNKKTEEIIYRRDKTGQIPLFVYKQNDHIILSNTIKSIVKCTGARPNDYSLELWNQSKHFIYEQTPWQNIFSVNPQSTEVEHSNNLTVGNLFEQMQPYYRSYLKSASVNSGGVDSGIVSKWFGDFEVAIDHVGKDFVSNNLDFAYRVSQDEWCNYVNEFIEATYLFPYTWSWVGYYILGAKLKDSVNILYTGEGADEIFGGYPDYAKGIRTPYSKPFNIDESNLLVNNKLSDQKYFIPCSSMGANLALGCFTIEPRSPFLDRSILNNFRFRTEDNKASLKNYYKELYGIDPAPKQGFAGFPDEYGNSVSWKAACFNRLCSL